MATFNVSITQNMATVIVRITFSELKQQRHVKTNVIYFKTNSNIGTVTVYVGQSYLTS